MKSIRKLFFASIFSISLLCLVPVATVGLTGCAYFKSQTKEAIVFYTFKDSWTLSHTAYKKWSERVVSPDTKITKAQSNKVDEAWNKYRIAFSGAAEIAAQGQDAFIPSNLGRLQETLIQTINLFSH